jgi:hypothetical protein
MREKQKQVEKERRGVLEYLITLSQTLAYKRAAQHLIITRASCPRQYTAFLATVQERPNCFCL